MKSRAKEFLSCLGKGKSIYQLESEEEPETLKCPYCNKPRPFEIKLIETIDKKSKVYLINFSCHMIIRKSLRNGVKK